MTQANDSNDFTRETNRRFRDLSWRVERLESTQMPARSLNEAFDRVYEEIDSLEDHMNERFNQMDQRFNQMDQRFDRLEQEFKDMNGKINIIMQHITGLNPNS